MSGSSDAGEILDENRESQDAGSQDGMSAATGHVTDISNLLQALNLYGAPKTSETVKSKSTIEKSTTEEEWKWYEQCIIERKLQLQFDKTLRSYYERNTILGRHLMPPMYFYTANGTLQKYNHIPGPPRTQPCQVWKEQPGEIDMPTQISESKHYQRIRTIIQENPVTMDLTPSSKGCLYYVILRLPGVADKYNDQGYIGITTTSVEERWRKHDTASVIDKNLRLIQEHCKCAEDQTTYYEMLSAYAAIFVLLQTTKQELKEDKEKLKKAKEEELKKAKEELKKAKEELKKAKEEELEKAKKELKKAEKELEEATKKAKEDLEGWEAYYMCQTYCTTHGGVGVMTPKDHKESLVSGCSGTCIYLGEKEYGMNNSKKSENRAKSFEKTLHPPIPLPM